MPKQKQPTKYRIKQIISGKTLRTVEATDQGDALQQYAIQRGYDSWSHMAKSIRGIALNIYAEKVT